jgi:hypothetical protein
VVPVGPLLRPALAVRAAARICRSASMARRHMACSSTTPR